MPRRSLSSPKPLDTYAALALEDQSVRLVVAKDNPPHLEIIADEEIPTGGDYGLLTTNVDVVAFVSRTLTGLPELRLTGAGISAPGIVDHKRKSVSRLSRYSSKRNDKPENWPTILFVEAFSPWVEKERIVVGNDAAMSAIGERWQRHSLPGPEDSDFAYIRIGTGINAALIINGVSMATEFAHISVATVEGDSEDIPSLCPYHKNPSCLEGRAGYERLKQLAARFGWEKTEEIAAAYIAEIFHMVTLLLPPAILVAENIATARGEPLLHKIRTILTERTAQYPAIKNPRTYIQMATLPVDEAAWRGALMAAIEPKLLGVKND